MPPPPPRKTGYLEWLAHALWFGLLLIVSSLILPQVQAANECGAVTVNGNSRTVTCSNDLPSGVTYTRQNGLDMTVGADGATPIEINPPANGAGIKVESWKTDTGDLSVTVWPVRIIQNASNNARWGINVGQRGTGSARVQVYSKAALGTEDSPLDEQGIFVWYGQDSSALLEIISDATIHVDGADHRWGAGIHASRSGAGNTRIVHGGDIHSQKNGISAWHGGTGGIDITHRGRIVSKNWGIFARKDGAGSKVKIVSSGDITTTGDDAHGIHVDVRASGDDPAEVTVEDGNIRATGHGVIISNRGQGAVTVQVMEDGSIGIPGNAVGGNGILVSMVNVSNEGTLEITSAGEIHAVGHGILAAHRGTGAIEVTNRGRIVADGTGIRNGAGIHASRDGAGNIEIINEGEISSQSKGVFAFHGGAGNIDITHRGHIESKDWGIFARKDGAGSKVKIVSSGDITTTGDDAYAIHVDVRASGDEPVEVTVEDGDIRATGHGVIISNSGSGAVTVQLMENGSIGVVGDAVDRDGINAVIKNTASRAVLKIASDGRIFAIGHGIIAAHEGAGAIEITHRGRINARNTGIRAVKSHAGNIRVLNSGKIISQNRGIYAWHGGSGAINITHGSEGSIVSRDLGIFARKDGSGAEGGITVTSRGNIKTTGYRRAGIDAQSKGQAATGSVTVHHESGKIESYTGIVARSLRSSGSRFELPASAQGFVPGEHLPVRLHVVSGGEIKALVPASNPSLDAARNLHQVGWKVGELVTVLEDAPIGIVAGTIDTQLWGQYIAAGDAPRQTSTASGLAGLITDEVRTQFRSVLETAMEFSGSPENRFDLGNLFDPRKIVGLPADPEDLPDLSEDDALDAWLVKDDGAVLLQFLRYTLSAQEAAVVEALFTKQGLEAALAALPEGYTEAYKDQVRWLSQSYNDAEILVEVVDGGRIESEGDGIGATHRVAHADNGKITMKVHEGAVVTARRYGIRVRGAGTNDRDTQDPADDILDQTVLVEGEVHSTGANGAGIYIPGGGTVIVGFVGSITSASGTSILASDPGPLMLEIRLDEDERPSQAAKRALPGAIVNSLEMTDLKIVAPETVLPSLSYAGMKQAVMDGAFDVGLSARQGGIGVVTDYAPRSRVYEALPSVLLGMNGMAAKGDRTAKASWARATVSSGDRRPADSTSDASYKYRWQGIELGKNHRLDDERIVGISLHHRRGSADVRRGGDIDVTGTGLGLSYTWMTDRTYVDLQAATTFYDVDLKSQVRGRLEAGRSDFGHALGVAVGRKMAWNHKTVTPRARLVYSSVELGGFTDELGVKVSKFTAWDLKSHLGVGIEKPVDGGHLRASMDLEYELEGEQDVIVAGTPLSWEARDTMLRLGLGKEFSQPDEETSVFAGIQYGTDNHHGHEIQGILALQF